MNKKLCDLGFKIIQSCSKCVLREFYHRFYDQLSQQKCMYAQLHEADSNILLSCRGTEDPGKLNV